MPTISFSIGGEQHDITGLSGDEVCDMIKMNYIAEDLVRQRKAEAEAEAEAEDNKKTIKKEIDLNFAINVYDEVKYNVDKLDEELHSAWLQDLENDIEILIQGKIREKLCVSTGDFDGDIVINDTGY